jgi:hypothetical protein
LRKFCFEFAPRERCKASNDDFPQRQAIPLASEIHKVIAIRGIRLVKLHNDPGLALISPLI